MDGSTCQDVPVVEEQEDRNTAGTPEEDEDLTILTQDDDNDLQVFSIRSLPSRRTFFHKRHNEQAYLREQQLKERLLACFECFMTLTLVPDCPYKGIDRAL